MQLLKTLPRQPNGGDADDDASIRRAARATLWFVTIVVLALWVGAVAA
jgi:hypothetical protein